MVFVDDLVAGLKLLGTHPAAVGQVFILGGERYYQLTTITGMIADLLGVRRPRLRLPARPFQIAGSICEAICVPLGIEPPIYRRRVDFFTKSRAFSIAKARRLVELRNPRSRWRPGSAAPSIGTFAADTLTPSWVRLPHRLRRNGLWHSSTARS